MRTFIASLAAVAALGLAVPAFAQSETESPAAPVPTTKPQPGTQAYCKTLKTASSRNACLKRVQAQAAPAKAPVKTAAKTTTHKAKKPAATHTTTPPPATSLAPPTTSRSQVQASVPVQQNTAAVPASPAPPQTIQVPPLPQKTI